MRTFAQKQNQPQERVSSTLAPSNTATSRQNLQPHTILHVLRALGNQAVLRLLQANAEAIEGGTTSTAPSRFAHDFSLLPTSTNMPVKIQTRLTVNASEDIYEQEADRVSEQVMSMPEPQLQRACACGGGCPQCQTEQPGKEHERLQTKRVGSSDLEQTKAPPVVHEVLSSPGQPLDTAARVFIEPRFGQDFSRLRVHTDEKAAESARMLRARAYTLGRHIVFAQGQYRPLLAEGRRLLAHELTHVAQQTQAGRPALQLKSELESFPEEERKKVQVLTSTLNDEGQKNVDQLYLSGTDMPIPTERTVTFGTSVAEFRRKGLKSVAASLTTPVAGAPRAFLPRNSAINLAIPAAAAVFRFTRFDRPSTAVAGATGPTPEVVLVEEVGVIPREPKPLWEAFPGPFSEAQGPLPAREASRMRDCLAGGADLEYCRREVLGQGAPQPAPVVLKPGSVEIRKVGILRGPNWKESEWTAVSAALEALPDSALKHAAGVTFLREAKNVCKPEEVTAGSCNPELSGENDAVAKKITIFDNAFKTSTTRYGTSSWVAMVVAHEVGHQADFAPLGTAFAQFRRTNDEAKVLAARSRSGSAWVKHARNGRNLFRYTEVGGGAATGSFREAAIQDGLRVEDNNKRIVGGGVTEYGEQSWRELFAESFALYMTDPDLLRAIRPNVFMYLEKTYPK